MRLELEKGRGLGVGGRGSGEASSGMGGASSGVEGPRRALNPRMYISNTQLSEMCRIQDDSAMAAELIQRCLYSIEAAFHSSFSLTSGKCRISYKNRENRGD